MKSAMSFPVLILLALLTSCSGGSNDLDRHGLKGKVKATMDFQCDATYKNEQWVAGVDCSEGYRVVEYDTEGNYQKAINMAECGDTTSMSVAKWENGEMVEEIYYNKIHMTPVHTRMVKVSRTVMDRVSDEQVNFEVWQDEQLRFEGATYYDSKGRITKQVRVVENREVVIHSVYEKNLMVEMYQEELDGSRSVTQHYDYAEFDDEGNWTLKLVYQGADKITPELAISRLLEYY